MTKEEYKVYLLSPHWREFSHRIKADVKKCQECGVDDTLNVHHLNYDCIYAETSQDVTVLCERCHLNLHILEDRMKLFGIKNVVGKSLVERRDSIQSQVEKMRSKKETTHVAFAISRAEKGR